MSDKSLKMLPLPLQLVEQAEGAIERIASLLMSKVIPSAEMCAFLATSDFTRDTLLSHPDWLLSLQEHPPTSEEHNRYYIELQHKMSSVDSEEQLMKQLREFRYFTMMRIAWLQATQQASTEQVLLQLSVLAEVLIISAHDFLHHAMCQQFGTPLDKKGRVLPLWILGMGKLGGKELNFSSDVDLIFVYFEDGSTSGQLKSIENSQFFTRLGQKLIRVLNQWTDSEFVYRVDMRLRPFGESAPLVINLNSFEEYYLSQGRSWERYAMIKARLLGENTHPATTKLYTILRSFVYRRYLDFSNISSLRKMKKMIDKEVERKGIENNIKLGAGGIREIEFIVQVYQLIRGGTTVQLQNSSLLAVLPHLVELRLLTKQVVEQLRKNYLFLRRLENILQTIADQQTHTLPTNDLDKIRLAWCMGYSDWGSLHLKITECRKAVRKIFNTLIKKDEVSTDTLDVDKQEDNEKFALSGNAIFSQYSETEQAAILQEITDFKEALQHCQIGTRGRKILKKLVKVILIELFNEPDRYLVMQRIFHLVLNIVSRTTYLELLFENRSVLKELIQVCHASSMLAEQLAHHPMLLGELINPDLPHESTSIDKYQHALEIFLQRSPEEDEEQQLDAIRQFKHIQQFRIAFADIKGLLPLMKVSDHLTFLAEAIIERVVEQAFRYMIQIYGTPAYLQGETRLGFQIVGYGKLGGIELGYHSDLDLIFLIDAPHDSVTMGAKSIPSYQFYLRLAQRVIHLLETKTTTGVLYEIDTRLRPSGNSGLLVSNISAYEIYQQQNAWTWEHQALVRSRVVYSDKVLAPKFKQIREQILCQPRVQEVLQKQIALMRKKMHLHHEKRKQNIFNLKSGVGGIIDIEFIAQYLLLNYANQYPELAQWSDNIRIFTTLIEKSLLSKEEGEALIKIYIDFRTELHHRSLQGEDDQIELSQFQWERHYVKQLWERWIGDEEIALPKHS